MTAPTPRKIAPRVTSPVIEDEPKLRGPTLRAAFGDVELEDPEPAADPDPDGLELPDPDLEEPLAMDPLAMDPLDMEPLVAEAEGALDPDIPEMVAIDPETPSDSRAIPLPTEL